LPVMRVLDADPAFKKKAAVASDLRCRGHVPLKGTAPQGREATLRKVIIESGRDLK
jgi:hypothetical protein